MNDNEFSKVGLYKHNAESYRKVREAYESGEKVVGIVHATGTGKTYNALQLAYDNPDKKILWVVPNNSISEHIENIIRDNPNLDRERDFKNVEFRTYQSFINMSREELSELDCGLLILDEFHHLGAPVWGSRINTIVETHPDMMVFGMTAYTVRDRGTAYERDMADPDTNELFSNKIVSRYDLVDAMLDKVLPMEVIYRTGYTHLLGLEKQLEEKINSTRVSKKELEEYKRILESVKKRIAEAPTIETIMKKYIKPNGKYLYFCPPRAEDGTNDVESIMKEAYEWFSKFVPEEDIEFYVTTSDMKEEGKKNREAFYNDLTLDGEDASGKLRVMFAINQYNEGVHAPNVDGVIMGRGTKSDIIFFEQLGRALSVRGDVYKKYQEYESYTYDELVTMAKDKDIKIDDSMTSEDIIEKLMAPLIIDLGNNIEFIKTLENNLKYRQREKREKGTGTRGVSKLREVSFDIDIVNEDLYEVLSNLRNRIYRDWNSMYELAKGYYEHKGDLNVPRVYKTLNGYEEDENGVDLGQWIRNQRNIFNRGDLSQDKIDKLKDIGMIFVVRNTWLRMYKFAKQYYDTYGNLDIPVDYEVKNIDGESVNLYGWIEMQYDDFFNGKLSNDRKKKLELIGMKFPKTRRELANEETDNQVETDEWTQMYKLAKAYYVRFNNLNVPLMYKTNNGYSYSPNGKPLGEFIASEKKKFVRGEMSEERKAKWEELGFSVTAFMGDFKDMYRLAKFYFDVYRHLDIPTDFKTNDGYSYDDGGMLLGAWLKIQLLSYRNGKLSESKKRKLEAIGMIFDNSDEYFNSMYEVAKKYYKRYGALPKEHYSVSPDGYNLGAWLYYQKHLMGIGKLSSDKVSKLKELGVQGIRSGMDEEDFDMMCELARKHYLKHGAVNIPIKFRTFDGCFYDNDGYNLGLWVYIQIKLLKENKVSKEKMEKLRKTKLFDEYIQDVEYMDDDKNFNLMYELSKIYYEHNGHLNIPDGFRTIDGFNEDSRGWELGKWLLLQKAEFKNGNLNDEQFIKLKEIKFEWTIEDVLWDRFYDYTKKYYDKYGNLDMGSDFKTINGVDAVSDGVKVGSWLKRQINQLKDGKLNPYRRYKLEQVGIKLEDLTNNYFEKMYAKAKAFYEEHGHLDVRYKIMQAPYLKIGLSAEEFELLIWKEDCKRARIEGKLDAHTYRRLLDIGVFMNSHEANWNNMYTLALLYYKKYDNLDVPDGFRTFDGVSYDEHGFELSKWIKNQILRFKQKTLTEERITKLNAIGIEWKIRNNESDNKKICSNYGIDYKLNRNIIKRISTMELVSKINFLLYSFEDITTDGKLHKIFSMSSRDISIKYGLSLEEIVNKFYTPEDRKRVL